MANIPQEIFKAYDIRGIVGKTVDAGVARNIGRAFGSEIRKQGGDSVVVARDGRLSGPELVGALADGLREAGVDVVDIGMVPTPVGYFAASVPLARGWERQLDTANNPLFYGDEPLTPATYDSWLLDNGVRFVALPDAALDYAGKAEGQLVAAGVPGLTPVWHDAHWRVFSVAGATGIVSGPARPVLIDGGNVKLDMTGPGDALVRVRILRLAWRRFRLAWALCSRRRTPRCSRPMRHMTTPLTKSRPNASAPLQKPANSRCPSPQVC